MSRHSERRLSTAPTDAALQTVLHRIITRMMKLLTRRGVLVEEAGSTYFADSNSDSDEVELVAVVRDVQP